MVEPPPLPVPSAPAPAAHPPAPHRGGTVFILGLLGLFGLLPLGAAAWAMANRDLDRMETGLTDRAGAGLTRTGKTLGAIGLIGACVTLGGAFLLLLLAATALAS
ncbi:MAG: hypothetical protein MUE73_17335 [Planctomycetes bacterium]|jgi:hypothetical protein|nr:hypothetical protein [Planctomycetota bacterium]